MKERRYKAMALEKKRVDDIIIDQTFGKIYGKPAAYAVPIAKQMYPGKQVQVRKYVDGAPVWAGGVNGSGDGSVYLYITDKGTVGSMTDPYGQIIDGGA